MRLLLPMLLLLLLLLLRRLPFTRVKLVSHSQGVGKHASWTSSRMNDPVGLIIG